MSLKQKEVFLEFEGDQWFERNKDGFFDENNSFIQFKRYVNKGDHVLEIGCAEGKKLEYLTRMTQSQGFGIDPSKVAIENGAKNYQDLTLKVGTADVIEYPDEYFDVVIFGFCLYLVDRKLLTKVVSEADRVLKPGGYLGIIDFDSEICVKRSYKYIKGVYSFKMDYSKLFTAFPHFTLVEKTSYAHDQDEFTSDINERLSRTVMYKDMKNDYFDIGE
jgi:ubiquinone/menaquinone biosynthesis C-methylase UbiE